MHDVSIQSACDGGESDSVLHIGKADVLHVPEQHFVYRLSMSDIYSCDDVFIAPAADLHEGLFQHIIPIITKQCPVNIDAAHIIRFPQAQRICRVPAEGMTAYTDSFVKINHVSEVSSGISERCFRILYPFVHSSHMETAILILKGVKLFCQFLVSSVCPCELQSGKNAAPKRLIGLFCETFVII